MKPELEANNPNAPSGVLGQPVAGRRVVQIAMSSTDNVVNDAANYLLAALCNDGTVFIASATTEWRQMSPIPQPPNAPDEPHAKNL